MDFDLRVTFTGLCLHVIHPDTKKVTVLQPDCRVKVSAKHEDGKDGIPHAGYLSFDLAHLDTGIQGLEAVDGPPRQVVFRFDRHEVGFGLPEEPMEDASTGLPAFEGIAPESGNAKREAPLPEFENPDQSRLQLKKGLLGPNPPQELLMRVVLTGGTLRGDPEGSWSFPNHINPEREEYRGEFSDTVIWKRTVRGQAGLTATFTGLDGQGETSIPLRPLPQPDGSMGIALKIANLCSDNPLEWEEFGTPEPSGGSDLDFKWLYRLVEVPGRSLKSFVPKDKELPVPTPQATAEQGMEKCMGATIKATGS